MVKIDFGTAGSPALSKRSERPRFKFGRRPMVVCVPALSLSNDGEPTPSHDSDACKVLMHSEENTGKTYRSCASLLIGSRCL